MRYLISLSYDGSKFYGFQRLSKQNSVQKALEEALGKINKSPVEIKGAGRTDRGVHALDQKCHFDLDMDIPVARLRSAINDLVGSYIYIKDCKLVNNDFHVRFDVTKKEYVYKINLGENDPLLEDYTLQINYNLDIKKMKKCAKEFIGVHNFKNFVSGKRNNYEAIIYKIEIKRKKNILTMSFIGKSFYRYMVRNLVGALLEVGKEKVNINEVKEALNNTNKEKNFTTAPANGLYLVKIEH